MAHFDSAWEDVEVEDFVTSHKMVHGLVTSMHKHRHDKAYIGRLLMTHKFEAAGIALKWDHPRAEPSDDEGDGEESVAPKGSITATEPDHTAEEVKKEPITDSMLGKRAEPEPADDPDTSDWI